jgi:hypothetical protein
MKIRAVRVSDSDWEAIRRAARAKGMNVSSFIRSLVFPMIDRTITSTAPPVIQPDPPLCRRSSVLVVQPSPQPEIEPIVSRDAESESLLPKEERWRALTQERQLIAFQDLAQHQRPDNPMVVPPDLWQ